jgi:hypothetical protein
VHRRFCDDCLRVHDRERITAWKRANAARLARYARDRRRRQRAAQQTVGA